MVNPYLARLSKLSRNTKHDLARNRTGESQFMNDVVLYDYWRSSASYRVRIALNLARIQYRIVPVDLLQNEHKTPAHIAKNPQGRVPVLEIDESSFTQSLAIIDYLDTTHKLNLLPKEPKARTKALALAHAVAIDIHPVCNISVVNYATGGEEPLRTDWMHHFIGQGLAAFEDLLADFEQAPFSIGKQPTLPDICLIPQLYNAERWNVDFSSCARIRSIKAACDDNPAFQSAHPDRIGAA